MTRNAWLTPSNPSPTGTLCRALFIPDDEEWIAIVNGALVELTRSYNYEQFGAATPDEVAYRFMEMYQAYVEGCVTVADLIIARDEKPAGTQGGSFQLGAWRVRDLTALAVNQGNHAALLGSGLIQLSAGIYRCTASVPAFNVGRHVARLWNVSDGVLVLSGTSEYSSGSTTHSMIEGRFTLAATKSLRIEHFAPGGTQLSNGFGVESGAATEIYTMLRLEREGD